MYTTIETNARNPAVMVTVILTNKRDMHAFYRWFSQRMPRSELPTHTRLRELLIERYPEWESELATSLGWGFIFYESDVPPSRRMTTTIARADAPKAPIYVGIRLPTMRDMWQFLRWYARLSYHDKEAYQEMQDLLRCREEALADAQAKVEEENEW